MHNRRQYPPPKHREEKQAPEMERASVNPGTASSGLMLGREVKKRKENIFEEIMAKYCPNLMKTINPQIQEAQPTPM